MFPKDSVHLGNLIITVPTHMLNLTCEYLILVEHLLLRVAQLVHFHGILLSLVKYGFFNSVHVTFFFLHVDCHNICGDNVYFTCYVVNNLFNVYLDFVWNTTLFVHVSIFFFFPSFWLILNILGQVNLVACISSPAISYFIQNINHCDC